MPDTDERQESARPNPVSHPTGELTDEDLEVVVGGVSVEAGYAAAAAILGPQGNGS